MCQDIDLSFPSNAEDDDFDNLATALLDTKLLEAVQLINMDLKQETRQVVLLGCGLDSRPHRHAEHPLACIWCISCHQGYVVLYKTCNGCMISTYAASQPKAALHSML